MSVFSLLEAAAKLASIRVKKGDEAAIAVAALDTWDFWNPLERLEGVGGHCRDVIVNPAPTGT